MPTDKGTRAAIRAFEEKMRTEGADGFAAGPHPWENWDVSGNAESNDRIWDNSALHEGGRKRTRSGPGERLLNGLAMLALLALLVGIGGVYFSEEPELTIAQQGVQPLPIIRKPRPVPAAEPTQPPSIRPAAPTGAQRMPAAATGAPESFTEAPPTPVMEVPAPAGRPVAPVPESPPGARAGADIAMAEAGEPAVIGAPSSAVSDVPAEDASDIAEPETQQAPEAPQTPEAIAVTPSADDMPLSTASGLLDGAPDTAEPEATPAPAGTPPPAPEMESAAKPAAEQSTVAVAQTTSPAPATALPPVEVATQPPAPPSATPASDKTVTGSPSGDSTAAADNAATPQPAPVAPEPAAPEQQPAVARSPNVAALMPADASGGWAVNLVSYTHETAARRILKEYRDEGIDAEIQMVILNDKPMYRVRIVGYESRPAAQAQIDPLEKLLDLDSVWVSRK